MANTTFSGPVIALNGFIGGPNVNAQDTAQGGTTPYAFTNVTTITSSAGALVATENEGVCVYTSDCISSAAGYVFSNGTTWKQMNAPASDIDGV
jgi:hypothetical protein